MFDAPLTFPDAARIMPTSMAASAAGEFVVSGGAYSDSGEGVRFLAFLDKTGSIQRLIRLGSFSAMNLAYSGDGKLWVIGHINGFPASENPEDYDLLRVYDGQGNLLLSNLKRSSFTGVRAKPWTQSWLAGNARGMVFLSTTTQELVFFDPQGQIASRSKFPSLGDSVLFTGMTVTEQSEIYISAQVRRNAAHAAEDAIFYRWNQPKQAWDEIYSRTLGRGTGYHAIFGSKPDGFLVSTSLPEFQWITQMPTRSVQK